MRLPQLLETLAYEDDQLEMDMAINFFLETVENEDYE